MGEYVKRSDALQAVGDVHPLDYNGQGIVERIKSIPAADVVEVRHGMWGIVESWKRKSVYRCSECGNFLTVRPDTLNGGRGDMNYCPNCGAKMDGGMDNG